ncbi:putative nicotinate-nucleotide adenylyltransferase [Philodulcilactobacillus myokoensis]|uniref:Probable nicotinate-nucleotide adenylyltransferase n=1 Tax=Philodulcilactobacillus myokoensis TaxID=2929573 RepID=A0A9W6B0I6_9LACO|nr:nicotinate-nucleotide adenylyltransferase [Philodulcilactobacillus myokoensis]GLB46759.1 putative nicotinate-nucleotide adenylyltransferase [Philodulcilactobacillus myokoensis]
MDNRFGKADVQTVTQLNHGIKRKKIGILGGTFNPIHNGHLLIADQVQNQLGLDQVLFMPDNIPPHIDPKLAIDAKDRINMINLAINNNPKFSIEKAEIKRGGKSYSYDTMLQLTRMHPYNEYYFIIGGDMVEYLPKWYKINQLINLVHFVGVRRSGYPTSSKYPVIWVDVPYFNVSSTLVRRKIKQRASIRYLVPDQVIKYIKEYHLYE